MPTPHTIKPIIQRIAFFLLWISLSSFTYVFYVPSNVNTENKIDINKFVERHNYYRRMVGVPAVKWSDDLAAVAQKWANRLALKCDLDHSKNEYGENIYWHSSGTIEETVVDSWADEKRVFKERKHIYRSGKGYGHYTQIIWKKTTHIGAAVKNCKGGGQIWVCNYNPRGNWIGEKVY